MLCTRDPQVPDQHSTPAHRSGQDVLVLAVDAAGTREALEVASARACALSGRVVLGGPMLRPLWWALVVGSWMMSAQASADELAAAERHRLRALTDGLEIEPVIACPAVAADLWVPLLLRRGRVGLVLIGAAGTGRRARRQVRRHLATIGERCEVEVLPVRATSFERELLALGAAASVAPAGATPLPPG